MLQAQDEINLFGEAKIEGVDFCRYAETHILLDEPLGDKHVDSCMICRRKLRVKEALLYGWDPLPRGKVWEPGFTTQMAKELAGQLVVATEVVQRFYATLARNPDIEHIFSKDVVNRLGITPDDDGFYERMVSRAIEKLGE